MDDLGKELVTVLKQGLQQAVKDKLCNSNYNNPLDKLLDGIVQAQGAEIKKLLTEAIASAMRDTDFRQQIAVAVRHKLAKTLIERFGGEMEKQVNMLKSDPMTRAKITLAIEEIVNERSLAQAS
jgi:hypothetical protein